MKTADLKVGMEVAIGPPSMGWGVKRAVVLGLGWGENRFGHFRAIAAQAERYYPTRDGKGGIAVAVLSSGGWRSDGETWEPDVVKAQQIRGPWEEITAQTDRADAAAKAERLREAERLELWTARLEAVEERLTEFEGEVVTLRSQGDRVLVPIAVLERLLDRLDWLGAVTGVRSTDAET